MFARLKSHFISSSQPTLSIDLILPSPSSSTTSDLSSYKGSNLIVLSDTDNAFSGSISITNHAAGSTTPESHRKSLSPNLSHKDKGAKNIVSSSHLKLILFVGQGPISEKSLSNGDFDPEAEGAEREVHSRSLGKWEKSIWGKSNPGELPPGTHEFPFTFPVPSAIPPTHLDPTDPSPTTDITYILYAVLRRSSSSSDSPTICRKDFTLRRGRTYKDPVKTLLEGRMMEGGAVRYGLVVPDLVHIGDPGAQVSVQLSACGADGRVTGGKEWVLKSVQCTWVEVYTYSQPPLPPTTREHILNRTIKSSDTAPPLRILHPANPLQEILIHTFSIPTTHAQPDLELNLPLAGPAGSLGVKVHHEVRIKVDYLKMIEPEDPSAAQDGPKKAVLVVDGVMARLPFVAVAHGGSGGAVAAISSAGQTSGTSPSASTTAIAADQQRNSVVSIPPRDSSALSRTSTVDSTRSSLTTPTTLDPPTSRTTPTSPTTTLLARTLDPPRSQSTPPNNVHSTPSMEPPPRRVQTIQSPSPSSHSGSSIAFIPPTSASASVPAPPAAAAGVSGLPSGRDEDSLPSYEPFVGGAVGGWSLAAAGEGESSLAGLNGGADGSVTTMVREGERGRGSVVEGNGMGEGDTLGRGDSVNSGVSVGTRGSVSATGGEAVKVGMPPPPAYAEVAAPVFRVVAETTSMPVVALADTSARSEDREVGQDAEDTREPNQITTEQTDDLQQPSLPVELAQPVLPETVMPENPPLDEEEEDEDEEEEIPTLPHLAFLQKPATMPYTPMEPDEIPIQVGDILLIRTAWADGFAHGINLTTQAQGVFPQRCLFGDFSATDSQVAMEPPVRGTTQRAYNNAVETPATEPHPTATVPRAVSSLDSTQPSASNPEAHIVETTESSPHKEQPPSESENSSVAKPVNPVMQFVEDEVYIDLTPAVPPRQVLPPPGMNPVVMGQMMMMGHAGGSASGGMGLEPPQRSSGDEGGSGGVSMKSVPGVAPLLIERSGSSPLRRTTRGTVKSVGSDRSVGSRKGRSESPWGGEVGVGMVSSPVTVEGGSVGFAVGSGMSSLRNDSSKMEVIERLESVAGGDAVESVEENVAQMANEADRVAISTYQELPVVTSVEVSAPAPTLEPEISESMTATSPPEKEVMVLASHSFKDLDNLLLAGLLDIEAYLAHRSYLEDMLHLESKLKKSEIDGAEFVSEKAGVYERLVKAL
ncbi:hypothetical protein HDV05_006854 [Chytridiales sp. JEL 0842]|nr:hypothetical protein HDV05_006854 [Chytridiales sp. JEL 0842]